MQQHFPTTFVSNEKYHVRMDSIGWITVTDVVNNTKLTAQNKSQLKDLIQLLEELYEKIP